MLHLLRYDWHEFDMLFKIWSFRFRWTPGQKVIFDPEAKLGNSYAHIPISPRSSRWTLLEFSPAVKRSVAHHFSNIRFSSLFVLADFRPILLEKYHGAMRNSRHTLRLQTALNRRGFPCPRCARTFRTSGGMSRHYRLECVDMPRFKCPHCDMRSKYTQAVYRHIRVKHHNMELRFVKLY